MKNPSRSIVAELLKKSHPRLYTKFKTYLAAAQAAGLVTTGSGTKKQANNTIALTNASRSLSTVASRPAPPAKSAKKSAKECKSCCAVRVPVLTRMHRQQLN